VSKNVATCPFCRRRQLPLRRDGSFAEHETSRSIARILTAEYRSRIAVLGKLRWMCVGGIAELPTIEPRHNSFAVWIVRPDVVAYQFSGDAMRSAISASELVSLYESSEKAFTDGWRLAATRHAEMLSAWRRDRAGILAKYVAATAARR